MRFYEIKLVIVLLCFFESGIPVSAQTVIDIDGNVYNTVTIGAQTWMVENLKTTKYRNGDTIPNVTDNSVWANLKTGAYCDYNNNPANSVIYGRLYNWYAVTDPQGLAPKGWHIANDEEWTALINFLGGESPAGEKLKEAGLAHWTSPNSGASNESGFTALAGGYRFNGGPFGYIRVYGYWWSSTENGIDYAWRRYMGCFGGKVRRFYDYKRSGFSVRCLKDN